MLGRLGMSVDEAIQAYGNFAKRVFSQKKWRTQDGAFKATELEKAIKDIVAQKLVNPNELMRSSEPATGCKT